ncbi:MAG: YitT family protein [Candidatus Riflebacteria bacterium]|nr:YitT family protein [Candidatus Riflebacteria bacterium]
MGEAGAGEFVCAACGYRCRVAAEAATWWPVFDLNLLVEGLFVLAGVLMAAVGLKGFLLPNGLIDGGVTGISMLLSKVMGWDISLLIVVINLPFLYLAVSHLNLSFAMRAAAGIGGLALVLPFFDLEPVTRDRILDAFFGGLFLGGGIGLSIRGGGVLDGTEVMALVVSKRFPATVGDVILGFNVVLFLVAGAFLPIEAVMYSILTYLSASRTVDFVMHGIESFNGVQIVSRAHAEIRFAIVNEMGRGVTVLLGKGGYSDADQPVLFCVVTRLEIVKLRNLALRHDPNAFIIVTPITDVTGGVIKKFLVEKGTETPGHG